MLCDLIQQGWAELLTGRTVPADLLNLIFAMGEVAQDKRYTPQVAAAAATRLAAALKHEAYMESLSCKGEREALAKVSSVIQSHKKDSSNLADRLLMEESLAAKSKPAGGQSISTSEASPPHCLQWCLGICSRENCKFLHSCPFKNCSPGPKGGCLLLQGRQGHLGTLQRREVKDKIAGTSNRRATHPLDYSRGRPHQSEPTQDSSAGEKSRSPRTRR